MKNKLLLEIAGILIILLFTYASLSKLFAFPMFLHELRNQPLPAAWVPAVAYGVPLTELAIVLLLAVPRWRTAGFFLATLFMLGFTSYAAIILLHGFAYVPCSCGGVIESLTWKQHLVLNFSFLALSVAGTFGALRTRQQKDRGNHQMK